MVVVLVVHTRNQKKREDEFDEAREKQLEEIRNGGSEVTEQA